MSSMARVTPSGVAGRQVLAKTLLWVIKSVVDVRETVGHVVSNYLGRSATFIYTTICWQKEFRPVVLAERTSNLSEFPFDEVHELIEPGAGKARRALRRARAHRAGFSKTYDFRLARMAQRFGCVALHAHFGWAGASALGARRRLSIPLITTFYGRDLAESRGLPYDQLFREGALFCCEGPAMAAELSSRGCPEDKIRIVRIGLDLTAFPFVPRQRERPLVIVQACRFVEKKGLDLSIRAFAAARRWLGESELWLVGDGDLRPQLESLAHELGVTDSVRFLGMVSHAEYRDLIRRAHICIQPSRTASDGDTEGGAPTVVLEMQATGIPVVSTHHADIPFVMAEPEHLAKEGDVDALTRELVRIAELSDSDWSRLVERGRSFVEARHDAAITARSQEDLYREALTVAIGSGAARPLGAVSG
jgi:colanic acid/amylovoran biosynthesis glycosyltransferase